IKDPTQLDARAELGFVYERGGDVDRAIDVLGDVLTLDPHNALALLYLGHALYRKGQTAKAEESFQASARVDPHFAEPHYQLGQLYEADNKKDAALKEYLVAAKLENHPDAAAAAKRLGGGTPAPH
ncbi:MAG TPA: tetratricopeptide repeat protein, partial [Myxococcaceae bacterium]|nr:tetratricopeptide repeat protein [Myxococcaceae bacterium]